MAHRSTSSLCLFASLALVATACSGSSGGVPHLTTIPAQSTSGGSTFSLDLGNYVTAGAGASLTYEVLSGGGSFSGSTYSNLFDTMGTYAVGFRVSEAGGRRTSGTFDVAVTSANFVVVKQDETGLQLLDADSQAFLVLASASGQPSMAAGLASGRLVYQIDRGDHDELWVYDPMTRRGTQLAASVAGSVDYAGKTSDGRIVFTTGSAPDRDLYLFDPQNGLQVTIAAETGADEAGVHVDGADRVFFEKSSVGQRDLYYYDTTTMAAVTVSTDPHDESIAAALTAGGIVFTRRGAGGEQDLFYYHPAGGTFELGGSTGLGIADLDKTFAKAWSRTSDGTRYVFVAFTVVNSGNAEIYGWTRTTGQTAAIAAGSDFTFRDLAGLATATPDAFAVYDDGQDLWSYDFDAGTALRIIDSSSSSTLLATTASATVAWGIAFDGTTPNTALAINLATGTTVSLAGGVGWASDRTLANGDVVIRGGSGTKLAAFDVSAGTWGTPIIGTGLDAVGDGIADGDFVYRQTVSSQTDLAMWDASAAASVTVSNTAGNDTFQGSSSGKVFFTRTTDGHEQLFVWNATSLAETQLTVTDSAGLDHDYSVLGTYAGAR